MELDWNTHLYECIEDEEANGTLQAIQQNAHEVRRKHMFHNSKREEWQETRFPRILYTIFSKLDSSATAVDGSEWKENKTKGNSLRLLFNIARFNYIFN